MAALLSQNLSDLGHAGEVPKAERTILEGLRFKSIARVSWITEAAARVTALLEREGIKVVLLKGLALEHTVYGSKGLRQMSDADLLVAPADALRARDILIRDGFRSMSLKSPLYRHIILDLGNHLPELHRGGISVDLHYRLFGPEGEEMVERAIRDSVIITGVDREPDRNAAVTRDSEDGVGVSSGTDAAVNSGAGTPGAVASSESGAPGNGTGARPGLIGDAESSPITSSGVGFPDTALSSEAGTPGGALSTGRQHQEIIFIGIREIDAHKIVVNVHSFTSQLTGVFAAFSSSSHSRHTKVKSASNRQRCSLSSSSSLRSSSAQTMPRICWE